MIKKLLVSSLVAVFALSTSTTFAASVGEDTVNNLSFGAVTGSNYYDVNFALNQPAKIYAYIANDTATYQQVVVNQVNYGAGNNSFRWYLTKNGTATGAILDQDEYTLYVVARSEDGSFTLDIDSIEADLSDWDGTNGGNDDDNNNDDDNDDPVTNDPSGLITDVELNPDDEWDPSDEELIIEFELEEDVDDLVIEARNGSEVIEIAEEDDLNDDDYEFEWDGTDGDDEYVDEGFWDIVIEADDATYVATIKIEYDAPEFEEIFLSREQINLDDEEVTDVVFKTDRDALVTIELYYNGNRREMEIWDEEYVDGDEWYAVRWDGTDDDGAPVDADVDWELRVTLKNEAVKKASEIRNLDIDVDDDDNRSSSRADIQRDLLDPTLLDPSENSANIDFCIDDDAEVSLTIHRNLSGGGNEVAELIDDEDYDQGCYSISWDGSDNDGDELRDDIYSYKIVTDGGRSNDTAVGRFVIEDFGDDDDDDDDDDSPFYPPNNYSECGGYRDTEFLDNETCSAIEWATERGIFSGYGDGSFQPYKDINRAEVLKVTFEAFRGKVIIQPATGTNLGFSDLDPNAWYMPYARTAQMNGMLDGYGGTSLAGLNNTINRVELLKFVLEASRAFDGFYIPNYNDVYYSDVNAFDPSQQWYKNYAGVAYTYNLFETNFNSGSGERMLSPGAAVRRGEVALLLYRMNNAGLL